MLFMRSDCILTYTGCDCLGSIKYFGGWLNDDKGEAVAAENVICLHEQVRTSSLRDTEVISNTL